MPHAIAWFNRASSASATPGYSVFLTPWMDKGKVTTGGTPTLTQNSAELAGGHLYQTPLAVNDSVSWDIWLDAGTYKLSLVHLTSTNVGIYTMQLNAVSQGTIDGYSAGATTNVYTEITGVTVTSGSKTFKVLMATKNASSSNYQYNLNSLAWLRTGA